MEKCAMHEMLTFHMHAHIKIRRAYFMDKKTSSVSQSFSAQFSKLTPDKTTTHLAHEIT